MQAVVNWRQRPDKDMEKIKQASKVILDQTGFKGNIAVILGSGLGGFTDAIKDKRTLKYSEIPHYVEPTVEGHSGKLTVGNLNDKDILVANGRLHMYEGHSKDRVVFPIRVLRECGIENLIITNSAGSLRKENPPGTIMIIEGHLDFTFQDGFNDPDLITDRKFHSPELSSIANSVALRNSIAIAKGNYCWVLGPAYETSLEIKYFRSFNGSAVGMSTLPEIREGGVLGLKLLTLSLITNFAAGLSEQPLTHEEVLENAGNSTDKMIKLLSGIIEGIKK